MASQELAQQIEVEQTRVIWLGPIAPAWTVIVPLSISVTQDDAEVFVADSQQIAVHGTGGTVQEAITDFFACLEEYYELVQESANRGDPFDQAELHRLETFIRHTAA